MFVFEIISFSHSFILLFITAGNDDSSQQKSRKIDGESHAATEHVCYKDAVIHENEATIVEVFINFILKMQYEAYCFNYLYKSIHFWTQLKGELSRLTKLNLNLQEQLICQNEAARTLERQCTNKKMKTDGKKDAPGNIRPTVDGVSQRNSIEYFSHIVNGFCVSLNLPFDSCHSSSIYLKDKYVYPNGVSVLKASIDGLDIIPGDPAHDREYINNIFMVFFTKSYLSKQIKRGVERSSMLNILRGKKRYDTVKGKKI